MVLRYYAPPGILASIKWQKIGLPEEQDLYWLAKQVSINLQSGVGKLNRAAFLLRRFSTLSDLDKKLELEGLASVASKILVSYCSLRQASSYPTENIALRL